MRCLLLLFAAGCIPVLTSKQDDTGADGGPYTCPANSWVRSDPPSGLAGAGFAVGDVIADFRMPDQNGETTCLYQFYTHPILLDISTMWCGPCQIIAPDVQPTADAYADVGLVYVTVLAQDLGTDPPDQDELIFWADSFGIQSPVLSDLDGYYREALGGEGPFPGLFFIGPDMRIIQRDIIATDENIRLAIEDGL